MQADNDNDDDDDDDDKYTASNQVVFDGHRHTAGLIRVAHGQPIYNPSIVGTCFSCFGSHKGGEMPRTDIQAAIGITGECIHAETHSFTPIFDLC